MFNPVHDLPAQTAILLAGDDMTRHRPRWLLLFHERRPPFLDIWKGRDALVRGRDSLECVGTVRALFDAEIFLWRASLSSRRSSSDMSHPGRMTTRGGSPFLFRLSSESRTSRS